MTEQQSQKILIALEALRSAMNEMQKGTPLRPPLAQTRPTPPAEYEYAEEKQRQGKLGEYCWTGGAFAYVFRPPEVTVDRYWILRPIKSRRWVFEETDDKTIPSGGHYLYCRNGVFENTGMAFPSDDRHVALRLVEKPE